MFDPANLPKTLRETIDASLHNADLQDTPAEPVKVTFGGSNNTNLHVASLSGTLIIQTQPAARVAMRPSAPASPKRRSPSGAA